VKYKVMIRFMWMELNQAVGGKVPPLWLEIVPQTIHGIDLIDKTTLNDDCNSDVTLSFTALELSQRVPRNMSASEEKDMSVNPGDPTGSALPSATTNGQESRGETEVPESTPNGKAKNDPKSAAKSTDGVKDGQLSGAEKKKRSKEEKAARRAKEKQTQEPPDSQAKKGDAGKGPEGKSTASIIQTPKNQHKRTGSAVTSQHNPLALRPAEWPAERPAAPPRQEVKKNNKKVALFGHLYGTPRRTTIAGAGRDVHPAVLALGLQMGSYVICGSNARCVATLLVFKRVCLSHQLAQSMADVFRLLNHMSHLPKTPFLAISLPTSRLRLNIWSPVDHFLYRWETLSDGSRSPYQRLIQIHLSLRPRKTFAMLLTVSSGKELPLQVR